MSFSINYIICILLIFFVVLKYNQSAEFLFTYFILNNLTFIICYVLNNSEVSLGFAFGIFAIFSILRFRTDMIPYKDMTYIFIFMSLGVINSLGSNLLILQEVVFINSIIFFTTLIIEYCLYKFGMKTTIIYYDKIENILPENRAELLKDLKNRTGLHIYDIKMEQYNFLRDTVQIKIFSK